MFKFKGFRGRIAGYDIIARKAVTAHGYARVYPTATYSPWLTEAPFIAAYQRIKSFTMVDELRCWELWGFASRARGGAIVEIGVRKGGSGMLLAQASRLPVYLCDTFSGIPHAGIHDTLHGGEYSDTSADGVRRLALSLGLSNVTVVQGIFPDSASQVPDGPVALCHIDVDVYESAKATFAWAQSRSVPGSVVVFDDYGFRGTPGATKLVNEIRDLPGWAFVHNLNGHGVMIRLDGRG